MSQITSVNPNGTEPGVAENGRRPDGGPILALPIDLFPAGNDPLTASQQARWLWALLAVGVAARVIRYLLRFPLWEDECMLSANYLNRGYLELLQPLQYYQVCPALFLWAQLSVVKLFGFNEYALRLLPFLSGMGSLWLFHHLARRLLQGSVRVVAVGLFAVGYPMIRYTSEAKPYGCNLLVALVMLVLVVEWLRRPEQTRWLWAMAVVIGPAIGLSYPAVFVGGAISLVVGWVLWKRSAGGGVGRPAPNPVAAGLPTEPLRRGWPAWAVYNLALAGAFLAMLAVSQMSVGETNQREMAMHWEHAFPPLAHPAKFVAWFFSKHTGSMLAYPVGGPTGGSTLSFVLFAAGIAVVARRRQWLLLAILLAPLGLNFVAAAMHRFPYGGHARLVLFLAPAFSVLTAAGIVAGTIRLGRLRPRRFLPRPAVTVLALVFLVAAGSIVRDLTHPYKSDITLRARDFARWFWRDLACDGELVCLKSDTQEDLSPGTFEWGWSSLYLCNQRIYSPRHARGDAPQWDRVSTQWPMRCVLYRSATQERDAAPLARWLEDMQSRYRLVAHDRYPFLLTSNPRPYPAEIDTVEVFKFVLRGAQAGTQPPRHDDQASRIGTKTGL